MSVQLKKYKYQLHLQCTAVNTEQIHTGLLFIFTIFSTSSWLCFILFNSHFFAKCVFELWTNFYVLAGSLFPANPFSLEKDKVSRRTTFLLQDKLVPLPLLWNEISFSNSQRLEMIITWMNEMNERMNGNLDGMRISRFTVNIQSANYFIRVNSIGKNSIRICQSFTFCPLPIRNRKKSYVIIFERKQKQRKENDKRLNLFVGKEILLFHGIPFYIE